jgi:hypothetical protein
MLVVAGGTRATASTRHRLWNYKPLLEADGVAIDWMEYRGGREASRVKAAIHRGRFLRDLVVEPRGHDVILVQKVLPPAMLLRRWRASGARVVYDFDDALFHQALWGETARDADRRRGRFDVMLESATVVIAGSPPLAEYARTKAERVEVLYPSLLRSRFPESRRTPDASGAVSIGWVGNDQSQIYLQQIRMDFVAWSEEAELEAAGSFDLAISPLGPEPWSRARGGRVSVLLSMASSVPVVASPGGGLDELSGGSEGVMLVDDPAAWAAALDTLLGSADERARRGRAARAVIDGRIWAEVQYPKLRQVLFGD